MRDLMIRDCESGRDFPVIVERDSEGYYVASMPSLRGCHTQGRSLVEMTVRIREVIALCLELAADDNLASRGGDS